MGEPRSLERYIRGQILPRFIVRLREIEDDLIDHRRRLAARYAELRLACADDPERFEERWSAVARRWDFARVNELIAQHNDYYPMERNLPLDPQTGDYVTIGGRPYRRKAVGPEWVLEQFPARPPHGARASEAS